MWGSFPLSKQIIDLYDFSDIHFSFFPFPLGLEFSLPSPMIPLETQVNSCFHKLFPFFLLAKENAFDNHSVAHLSGSDFKAKGYSPQFLKLI